MERPKILIVDDKPENLLALEGVLRADDRIVVKAQSGREALELLLSHQFALAIIDVQMPEMTGPELAALMRGSDDTLSIPIIFVTAGVRDQAVTFEGFDAGAGAVDFLYKPLNERIVRSKVKVFLELDRQKRQLKDQITKLEASQTRLRNSQNALAESNGRLERFAYIASHDMKEPLRVINAHLLLLERHLASSLDENGRAFLDHAVKGVSRLATLLDSLIQFSTAKHQDLTITEFNLAEIFKEVQEDLSILVQERGAKIVYENPPDLASDRSRLRQLFQNLISNAIKYTDERPPFIQIKSTKNGPYWFFEIIDNGIGIPEALRSRIFEPFVRGERQEQFNGSGIGLAVCKSIVDRLGGAIWVEPNDDGGSTFCFTIPVTAATGVKTE